MNEYSPTGPKGRTFEVYNKDGLDAAQKFALDNFAISKTRVEKWFREWGPAKEPVASKPVKIAKTNSDGFNERDRVVDLGNTKRRGSIIKVGKEVCEVKWDDGVKQFVTNDYLRHIEEHEGKGKRKR